MSYRYPGLTHQITGNTSGVTAQVSSGTAWLAGGNNVTLSQNANTITISAANQSAQTVGVYASSQTTGQSSSSTYDARSLTLRGAGIVSVGNSGGEVIISATAAGASPAFSASGGSSTFQTLNFANSNSVTFTNTNGSLAIASIKLQMYATSNTVQSSSGTAEHTALTFRGAGNISVGVTGGSVVISGPTVGIGATYLSAGASNLGNTLGDTGLVGSQLVFAGGNNITLSQSQDGLGAATLTISAPNQTNQTIGAYAVSNTTQSTSGTIDARSLSFRGAGIASVGVSNGSVLISVPSGGGAGDGYNILAAGTQTANTTGTVVFSNSNGVSFGMSNSSVITASVDKFTLSYFNPQDAYPLVAGQQGQGTLHIQPLQAPDVVYDQIAFPLNYTQATNSTLTASLSLWFGVYTRNDSTLSLLYSTSDSASVNGSGTASSSVYVGPRLFTIGSTGTLTEGQYYVGIISRTSTSSANASISQFLCSQINSNFSGLWGVGTNASNQQTRGLGIYSATTSALPASIAFTQIRGTGSLALRQPSFYFASGTF